MKFIKMEGCGNDYIFIDCFSEKFEPQEDKIKKLCDRHFGIGGDGVVLIMPSLTADIKMRIFNADASEGRICGNALRCLARYLFSLGRPAPISVETMSGIKNIVACSGGVCVSMGKPSFSQADIPSSLGEGEVVEKTVLVGGAEYRLTCLSVGNPHAVIFTEEELSECPVGKVGAFFEKAVFFPEGINTSFARIIDSNTAEARVYERGSGETLACGSAAVAIACAARKSARIMSNSVSVIMPGGVLKVNFEKGEAMLSGDAREVFRGEV